MIPKYYRIEREYEPKLVGVKDASAQAELNRKSFVHKEKYDEYINFFLSYQGEWFYNQTRFPTLDFDFEYMKLKKTAILTDFLYFGPSFYHRYLVDRKVRETLKNFRLPPFKYYETKLYSNSEFTDEYKFFYSPSFNYDFVDFEQCHFSVGNNRTGKKHIQVQTKEQFLEIKDPVNTDKIVLKNFDLGLDYFNVLISPNPFISERLKNKFIEQKITGIRIVELDESELVINA